MKLGELGEMSFGIMKLGEMSFGMSKLSKFCSDYLIFVECSFDKTEVVPLKNG